MISAKDLAKADGVSGSEISQWKKPLIEKGVLMWVDQKGSAFPDEKSLEKAKHSGKAYLKVGQFKRLPTPFELTENPDWDIGGELYLRYDLGFESSTDTEVSDLNESEKKSFSFETLAESYDVENKEEAEKQTEGDKVLRSIPHKEVIKMVEELKENQEERDPNDPKTVNLFNEFSSMLKKRER